MEVRLREQYELWVEEAKKDQKVMAELEQMAQDEAKIEDAFYRELAFGTGGLRGVIGAGTNRMNIYTVAKASQGLANYVKKNFETDARKIAVSYDSRIMSTEFAEVASEVFAANGIKVFIYTELMPTPCLSYAVRELHCAAGIMITASHNPAKYNGYKVYGADGCQITTEVATEILSEIEGTDTFADVAQIEFKEGVSQGSIAYISEDIYTGFIEAVKSQTMLSPDMEIDKNVSIVYTPLNGAGLKPVLRALRESCYTNIQVVKEQEEPDGNFPTCSYPNPEIQETLDLGVEYAKRYNADLLLATDPDCDRVGIAVKNEQGEYVLVTGNEVGVLLLDYICHRHLEMGTMPENPVLVKTIVTTDMAELIADAYNVRTVNVLTGFKFIGEQIGMLEAEGKANSYVFGFEESYGYLSGTYVRDKDAVDGAFLICEMFAYYRSKGISLLEKLDALYDAFGYCLNTLHSYEFEGSAGFAKMQDIMSEMRLNVETFAGKKVVEFIDYNQGIDGLPKSNVLKFKLADQCSVVVRPSGTEPKLKLYVTVSAENRAKAVEVEEVLVGAVETLLS